MTVTRGLNRSKCLPIWPAPRTPSAGSFDGLANSVRDYAFSDGIYAYTTSHNAGYIQSRVTNADLNNLRLNVLAIYDRSGTLLYGSGFDYASNRQEPLPAYFADSARQTDPILSHEDLPRSNNTIITLPSGPMLVTSLPILTDGQTGPYQGSFVVGRYLTADTLTDLRDTTQLNVTLTAPSTGSNSSAPGSVPLIRDAGPNVVGSTAVRDFEGNPVLVLSITTPRTIFGQGVKTVIYLALASLVIVLAFAFLFVVLLERVIIARMRRLSTRVAQIGAVNDPSARISVEGVDEIARLGISINRSLDSLERSSRSKRETEARYWAVVDQTAESIFVIDPDTGFFLEFELGLS